LGINPNLNFEIQQNTTDKKIDKTIDKTRYFGAEGDLYDSATNKISSQSGVDWLRTTERIQQMFFASENKSMAERKIMKGEDRDARPYSNIKGIRPAEDQTKGNFNKVRAIDPYSGTKGVSTSSEEDSINAREKLLTMMETYSNKLASAKIIVRPVLLDGSISNDTKIIVESDRSIKILNNISNRNLPSMFSKVSWIATLDQFLSQTRDIGLADNSVEADPKRFKPSDKPDPDIKVNTRHATTGLKTPNADITDNEARKFLEDFFKIYEDAKDQFFQIELSPIYNIKYRSPNTYLFKWYNGDDSLRLMNRKTNEMLSPSNSELYFKNTAWGNTLEVLLEVMLQLRAIRDRRTVDDDTKKVLIRSLTYLAIYRFHMGFIS
jgi:hypothetical protein